MEINEATKKEMEEAYANRVGVKFGDYEVVKVEYDEGSREQLWTIRCTKCGYEVKTYSGRDWMRGKGRSWHCKECQRIVSRSKAERKAKRETEAKVRAKSKKIARNKKESYKQIQYYNKYIKPIGERYNNLTVVKVLENGRYIVRCDCGRECEKDGKNVRNGVTKTCGYTDCGYWQELTSGMANKGYHEKGKELEQEMVERFRSNGYKAYLTRDSSDYGVDVIMESEEGWKMAVQCKNHSNTVGVEAVQAVYAGGHFYGCDYFAVVATANFSTNAQIMAKKLKVALVSPQKKENISDKCKAHGTTYRTYYYRTKHGYTPEEALQKEPRKTRFNVFGEMLTLKEMSEKYGVSGSFIAYRMKTKGMTAEEAVTMPKHFMYKQTS